MLKVLYIFLMLIVIDKNCVFLTPAKRIIRILALNEFGIVRSGTVVIMSAGLNCCEYNLQIA